jgi:predicted dehydrogenase
MAEYRVAIIGTGGIARAHGNAWKEARAGRGKIVACADISREALDKYAGEYGVPGRYLDYIEMLKKEHPDIVHICTLNPLHAEMVLKAADYGPKAIVCEKPIALSLGDADDMIGKCRQQGILFVVTHQRRLEAANVLAKQALDAGEIGELEAVWCGLHPWSTLLGDGTHLLDLVFKYMDDIPAKYVFGNVFCKTGHKGLGHQNEDASYGTVHFANGKSAQFSTGGFENPENPSNEAYYGLRPGVTGPAYYTMTLKGSRGFIEVLGDSLEESEDRPLVRLVNTCGERSLLTEGERKHSRKHWRFAAVVEALIRSLDAKFARNPLEVITAMAISAKERRGVYLPLSRRDNPLFSLIDEGTAVYAENPAAKKGIGVYRKQPPPLRRWRRAVETASSMAPVYGGLRH